MEINPNLAYEIAKNLLMEKENKILELTILYNQALKQINQLQQALDEFCKQQGE